jgi:hypothetical protein
MSNRINVKEILEKHVGELYDPEYAKKQGSEDYQWLQAIKEIVEATVDLCAENANVKEVEWGLGVDTVVDKQSILNVKTQIDYE